MNYAVTKKGTLKHDPATSTQNFMPWFLLKIQFYRKLFTLFTIRDESKISQETLVKQLQQREKEQTERQQYLQDSFSNMIDGITKKLDEHYQQSAGLDQDRTSTFEQQLNQIVVKNSELIDLIGDKITGKIDKEKELHDNMIENLAAKLDENYRNSEDIDQRRSEKFNNQLNEIVAKNNEVIELIGGKIIAQIEREKELHDQRYTSFSEGIIDFKTIQSELTKRVESLISLQYDESELIKQGLSEMLDKFHILSETNDSASQRMRDSAKEMNEASVHFEHLSESVKKTTEKLSMDIGKAAELTIGIAEQNNVVGELFKESIGSHRELTSEMDRVVSKLRDAAKGADESFRIVREHLDKFQKSMTNQVVELDNHIQKLLINYADQVQSQTIERLNTWNTQTNDYISLMTTAVKALNDVVDELENKLGERK